MSDNVAQFYRRFRPTSFDQLKGQDAAVRVLQGFLDRKAVPHVLLLSGDSGTGKTTAARILKEELGCHEVDFSEVNAADSRGIDSVRDIRRAVGLAPMRGKCRVWLIDEVHAWTRDAQTACLKVLEDTPKHAYFFLCTTDPDKLLRTILTRCVHVKMSAIPHKLIEELLTETCERAEIEVAPNVLEHIAEVSLGSAREALNLLEKVAGEPNEKRALAMIAGHESTRRQAFDLVKMLLYYNGKWSEIVKVIADIPTTEHEKFRHLVLACANREMLKGGKSASRGFAVARAFAEPWYECKEVGLAASCYEVCYER